VKTRSKVIKNNYEGAVLAGIKNARYKDYREDKSDYKVS
jgi:hypothetical protein